MYSVYHGIVPDTFEGIFVYNNMIHYHDTRISGHLHLPITSSNPSRSRIRYHGVIILNNILTAAINPDSSEVSFKIMLKKRNLTRGYNTYVLNLEIFYCNWFVVVLSCTLPPKINTYLVGKFMYSVYHGIVPDTFEGIFVYNNMIYYHDTRISGHLHLPITSSNPSRSRIRYHGVIILNNILTAAINPDSSEVSFKIMLKKRNLTRGYNTYVLKLEIFYCNWFVVVLSCTLPPPPPPPPPSCTGIKWTIYEFVYQKMEHINLLGFLAPICHHTCICKLMFVTKVLLCILIAYF